MKFRFPALMEKRIEQLFEFHARNEYNPTNPNKVILGRDLAMDDVRAAIYQKLLKLMPELPESKAFIGIEVEIEKAPGEFSHTAWMETKDGSLRNNGKEYISYPLTPRVTNQIIGTLFSGLMTAKPRPDFSWRTSIHVHLCVRERTVEELLKLFLMYLVFERVMFLYADPEREKSIFCVPIVKSSHAQELAQFFSQSIGVNALMQQWHKYAALNIIRLGDYGTIEFRHLSGTFDVKKLSIWIGILLSLYNSAIALKLEDIIKEIQSLNTTSKYMLFRDMVFGKEFGKFVPIPDFELVSEGVSFCKECLAGMNKQVFEESSSMARFVRREKAKKELPWGDRPTVAQLVKMKQQGHDISPYLPNKPGKVARAPQGAVGAADGQVLFVDQQKKLVFDPAEGKFSYVVAEDVIDEQPNEPNYVNEGEN